MNATSIPIESRGAGANRLATMPAATETRSTTANTPTLKPACPRSKLPLRLAAVAGLTLLASFAGYRWWVYARTWVTTDDAYVSGHIHTVSTRIAGNVSEVLVTDNQDVAAGAALVRLDPQDLGVQQEKAQAQLAQTRAQLAQAAAQVTRDEAVARKAQLDFERAERLFRQGDSVIAKSEYDAARAALDAAQASLDAAKASVVAAEAQAQAAAAQLKDVNLQLGYTTIVAPATGRVGRKNVEVGNRVQPGQALLAIVQPEVWVTANFKETQLSRLRPGQAVKLNVDGLPGHNLIGRVDSVAPASGAQFALLPPDNATGNFTKIVQRVPVKIVLDDDPSGAFAGRLVPGMSVVVKVNVRT